MRQCAGCSLTHSGCAEWRGALVRPAGQSGSARRRRRHMQCSKCLSRGHLQRCTPRYRAVILCRESKLQSAATGTRRQSRQCSWEPAICVSDSCRFNYQKPLPASRAEALGRGAPGQQGVLLAAAWLAMDLQCCLDAYCLAAPLRRPHCRCRLHCRRQAHALAHTGTLPTMQQEEKQQQ